MKIISKLHMLHGVSEHFGNVLCWNFGNVSFALFCEITIILYHISLYARPNTCCGITSLWWRSVLSKVQNHCGKQCMLYLIIWIKRFANVVHEYSVRRVSLHLSSYPSKFPFLFRYIIRRWRSTGTLICVKSPFVHNPVRLTTKMLSELHKTGASHNRPGIPTSWRHQAYTLI